MSDHLEFVVTYSLQEQFDHSDFSAISGARPSGWAVIRRIAWGQTDQGFSSSISTKLFCSDRTAAEKVFEKILLEEQHRSQEKVGFQAGRFVLAQVPDIYVTSWDTWEEAEVAFPIGDGFRLVDQETGRVWSPGVNYDWEAAAT